MRVLWRISLDLQKKQKRSLLQVLLTSGLLASLSTALISYINSSFLETFLPENWVGIVFSVAYALSFIVIQNYARILERFKNYVVVLFVFAVEILSLFLIAADLNSVISLIAFITLVVGYNVVVINYDIFLEEVSAAKETGRIRGMFWTASNLGFLLGPFLSGILTGHFGFHMAYFVSGLVLIPPWLLIFFTYRNSRKHKFKKHNPLVKTIKKIHKNKDLRGIYLVALLLYLFYSWMVIYTPLHLLDIGFTWEQIGIIFTVMLVPFVLVEYPAGWLADRYFGETEMLSLGFAIMVLSVLALIYTSGYWAVMLVLFCSRIGASLVEIMRDTYFYKKVNEEDLDLVDLFRNTRSVAYVVGPILASGILALGYGIPQVFLALALLMFVGVLIPFNVKDTL